MLLLAVLADPASAQQPIEAPPTAAVPMTPLNVPRLAGRLRAADLGLVINRADPYSVAVGALYAQRRGLEPAQLLEIDLPLRSTLTVAEFELLRDAIAAAFGPRIQALALAWTQPYAVQCNSITGALALGFDAELCRQTCGRPSSVSPLFNSASFRPWTDLRVRPSMLLAARSVDEASALIDRGVAADASIGRRGAPPAQVMLLQTADGARNVRERLYPAPGLLRGAGVNVQVVPAASLSGTTRVVIALTGSARLDLSSPPGWLPGALADHLTSSGGRLTEPNDQSTALDWLASGATASHGSVSEPCNHLQKFPHPQVLLLHYVQGATALEAYWKSVAWPQQSLFIGEPLAAPFSAPLLPR